MNIAQLDQNFGIANTVKFIEGQGGLPFIQIHTDKAQALISVYAGQVLSFKPVSQEADLMFLSTKAYYQAPNFSHIFVLAFQVFKKVF